MDDPTPNSTAPSNSNEPVRHLTDEPSARSAAIRRQFATVQLTLLSVVVALILENLMGMLIGMEQRPVLVWIQGLDILMSAFCMWVGYAFAFMVGDKQPNITDFITPFALLLFLHLAAVCIATGNLTGYFFASAAATGSAAVNLWATVRDMRRRGARGPVNTSSLLSLCCVLELVGGVLYLYWQPAVGVAIGILLATSALQLITSLDSIKSWLTLSR